MELTHVFEFRDSLLELVKVIWEREDFFAEFLQFPEVLPKF